MVTTVVSEPPAAQDTQLPLSQASGTEPLSVQPSGTESLITEASGTEPSHGEQPTPTSPVKTPSAPMPSFTSQGPGTTRIAAPNREATLKSPTKTTPVEKGTRPMVEEKTPRQQARIDALVHRQRYGEPDGSPWNGLYEGMSIVLDSNGHERLSVNRTTVDEEAVKSKDVQKINEDTALLTLGSPKISTNKSRGEDEGLAEDLHDLLSGNGNLPVERSSASPLPPLRKGRRNYFSDNAEDYGTDDDDGTEDDEDLLRVFEQDNEPVGMQSQNNQPLGMQSQDNQPLGMQSQNNQPLGMQSQDNQPQPLGMQSQDNQPSDVRETRTQTAQPVLTQQGVIDLVSKDSMTFAPGSEWGQRKQGYCDMLKGYESPNGNTVSVEVDLAALIILSAVSESSIRNSLQLQQAANESLMKQAEEHRVLAQKQFAEGMARMQAEQEKAITEAARIRNEYAHSAKMAQVNFDSLMSKVEGKHNPNVMSLQMTLLKQKAQKHERELQDINDRHKEELQEKEALCNRYKRDLERALRKNQTLEKEKQDIEDQVMSGVVPQVDTYSARPESVDSSPELHVHKRPKMDSREPEIRDGKGREPEQGSSCVDSTTAYTLSFKDRINLGIITKDPATITAPTRSRSDQAKATINIQAKAVSSNAKVELYSRKRDVYNQAYDKVMSPSDTALRSETKEKHAVIAQRARDQAQAEKAQADKAQADKAQADKAQAEKARSANHNQAKAVNREKDQGESVPLVTREQKQEGLKMWKDLLIQTKDYRPFQESTEEENLKEVKFLRAAMTNFRLLKLQGMDSLQHEHSEFQYLQDQYYIPKTFCMPADLFREEQLDCNVLYYKRCCSIYDFYNMLSKDNPCYIDRRDRRPNHATRSSHTVLSQSGRQESPAAQDKDSRSIPPVSRALTEQSRATSTHQSLRQEPLAVQSEDSRSRPPAVYPPGTSKHQAFRLTKSHSSYRPSNPVRVNPSYNPFIHVGNQPIRQDVGSVQSTNPSNLDREQMESAEKAEVRRKAHCDIRSK